MIVVWLKFGLCVLAILLAGSKFIQTGDLTDKCFKFTKTWWGATFTSATISMPLLATVVASISFLGKPNLALSIIFGACLFNMLIIAFLDIIYNFSKARGRVLKEVNLGHILSGVLSAMLITVAALGVLASRAFVQLSIFEIGLYSFVILIFYIGSQELIYKHQKKAEEEFIKREVKDLECEKISSRAIIITYLVFGAITFAAGFFLPFYAVELATAMNWPLIFVGTLLIPAATGLPLLIMSATAINLGGADVVIGRIFNNNVYVILLIVLADLLYREGTIFSQVSLLNLHTALVAVVLLTIAGAGLLYRSERRVFHRIGWDAYGIIFIYIMGILVLLRMLPR